MYMWQWQNTLLNSSSHSIVRSGGSGYTLGNGVGGQGGPRTPLQQYSSDIQVITCRVQQISENVRQLNKSSEVTRQDEGREHVRDVFLRELSVQLSGSAMDTPKITGQIFCYR